MTLPARFCEKFEINWETGCWEWQAATRFGYGVYRHEGRTRPAHRACYEILVGVVPTDLDLDHLCRVRNCVNPEHLEPVTRKENIHRGLAMVNGEYNRVKTHCPKGHPYSGDNLYVAANGQRACRKCKAAASRRRSAAKREAAKCHQ